MKTSAGGRTQTKKLTDKQLTFCREYLIDLNATQAAIRAGYSAQTANQQGPRLLVNVGIQSEIQRLFEERSQRVEVTADRVLEELKALAFYDPGEIGKHKITGPQDIANLPEPLRRCIIGWGWDKTGNFTLKLSAKTPQIDLIGQHLGMWKNRLELTGKDGGPIETAAPLSAEAERELLETLGALRDSLTPPGK